MSTPTKYDRMLATRDSAPTCCIKWIDNDGKPTADSNPAIGRARTIARVEQIGGRGVKFDASDWFPICAAHAERLHDPGMHIWEFEPYAKHGAT